MSPKAKPPVWKMVKEAVEAIGGTTTNIAVRDWILKKYSGTNPTTISCQIIVSTVNHASRIHYPENQKQIAVGIEEDLRLRHLPVLSLVLIRRGPP
jgi:hypothetical protein